ncbi:MAG TPA: AIR synthase-related protein [Patescibacteria group bacterium]|nr:AIR synthase-related protein [Patescibacteria group bacterium]
MAERGPIQDVNIQLGDDVSRMLYEASKLTHDNRPGLLVEFHESFSGFRAIPGTMLKDVGNLYLNLAFDGVGTKVEVAERLDDHSVVAHDLFAMVCDDAVVRGAEPVAIGSILDVRQLDDTEHTRNAVKQLGQGYVEAAKAAGVVVVNGEVAELGDRVGGYGDFNYNWGATVLWLAHKERILTGHQIQPGDALVGLAEHGFRSNGITDVRKAMLEHYGPEWQDIVVEELGQLSLGRLVQKPSIIYSRFVSELTGGFDIDKEPKAKVTGVAHITGGGQPSKLGRMLKPSELGVTISDPIEPPRIMLEVQRLREFSDEKAYGKWHLGPGMVIATPEPNKVLAEAQAQGIVAQQIGQITDEPGIRIKNRGAVQDEEWLSF